MPDTQSLGRADRLRSAARGLLSVLAYGILAALLVVGVTSFVDDGSASGRRGSPDLSTLVASTTETRLPRAPRDTERFGTTAGDVVHPRRTLPVYAAPGRRPFAKVAPTQMGDTWLPVVDRQGDWVKVLLPSRPNGATGWLPTAQLDQRRTPYLVRVHTGSRRLELLRGGEVLGSWSVAVGAPGTPTPVGRTFLLGSFVDPDQDFSPVILPLGAHSDTLDTYGGGPGTVALHGWPDASVFGQAVSHGCVRVPADALEKLRRVPLGTLVIIDQD